MNKPTFKEFVNTTDPAIGTVNIKPLSINEAFQGRRFKTHKHEAYEMEVIVNLPPITLPAPPYCVTYTFGLSNSQADVDNHIKVFQDCLQKKYRFNDKYIYKLIAQKKKVKKGQEFVEFKIETFNE